MSTILIIAMKEVREALRNRWVMAMTLLMAALALTLSFLGSAPTGTIGAGPLEVTIVSLSSLTIFLLPLIALLLSFDAIVGEIDRGTMALLLSYPVARWQVMLGKFIGHAAVIAFAITLGYGAAGVALWFGDTAIEPESWRAFAAMIGTSIMLGAAFTALGYLASTIVRDRGTAAGIAPFQPSDRRRVRCHRPTLVAALCGAFRPARSRSGRSAESRGRSGASPDRLPGSAHR
jgi:Cu-processing system permease protein